VEQTGIQLIVHLDKPVLVEINVKKLKIKYKNITIKYKNIKVNKY
jgi:hypothetical protein